MPSSNTNTFDQDPPHRPGLSEVGGGQKKNHPNPALKPDPIGMPTAEDFNQLSHQATAAGTMMPLARIWVSLAGGTPAIMSVQAPGSLVNAESFAIADESDGVTRISWKTGQGKPPGALPAAIGVKAWQTDDVEIDRVRGILTTYNGDPAARIRTKLGGVATDCNFCLEIY